MNKWMNEWNFIWSTMFDTIRWTLDKEKKNIHSKRFSVKDPLKKSHIHVSLHIRRKFKTWREREKPVLRVRIFRFFPFSPNLLHNAALWEFPSTCQNLRRTSKLDKGITVSLGFCKRRLESVGVPEGDSSFWKKAEEGAQRWFQCYWINAWTWHQPQIKHSAPNQPWSNEGRVFQFSQFF